MRELHLFAGAGGGILGGMMLGHEPVCAVEIDKYCRRVLQARQDDGSLPPFPIYEDVRTFDGHAWRGLVDVICGGFPCQPFSCAGKQLGTADPRHLWPDMARIISEVRPRYVFAENVSLAAFEEPWRDLRRLGYRVPPAVCVSASDVGAPHRRKRWWLLAVAKSSGTGAGDHSREARNEDGTTCREQLPPLRQGDGEDGTDRFIPASEGEGEVLADAIGTKRLSTGQDVESSASERALSWPDGETEQVADAPSAQNHQKRGDCQCGRNAMGRNQQAPQQDHGQADNLLPCGLCGNVAHAEGQSERAGLCESESQGVRGRRSSYSSGEADTHTDSGGREEQRQPQPAGEQGARGREPDGLRAPTHADGTRLEERQSISSNTREELAATIGADWWATRAQLGRASHGMAEWLDEPRRWLAGWEDGVSRTTTTRLNRVDRLKAIGNGQVPLTAATAWRLLMEAHA